MTNDLFEKACKIKEDIEKYERFLNAINHETRMNIEVEYVLFYNSIKNYLDISEVPELKSLIKEFIVRKLEMLKEEFRNLKDCDV